MGAVRANVFIFYLFIWFCHSFSNLPQKNVFQWEMRRAFLCTQAPPPPDVGEAPLIHTWSPFTPWSRLVLPRGDPSGPRFSSHLLPGADYFALFIVFETELVFFLSSSYKVT